MAHRENAASSSRHAREVRNARWRHRSTRGYKVRAIALRSGGRESRRSLIGVNFHIGTDRNARHGHGVFRAHNADRDRMRLLGQKKNLFAGVHQAADGQHAIVLVHVGIKENRIASRVDHFCSLGATITGGNAVEHPGRRSHDRIGAAPNR